MKNITVVCLIILGSFSTMAYGQIKYMPYPSRAINLSGAYALLLAESDNLIGVNPGAETGDMTGWTTNGGSVTAVAPYAGTYSFDLTSSGKYLQCDTDNLFSLTKNTKYKIVYAVKGESAGVYSIHIYDTNGLVVYSAINQAATTSWVIKTINFTADRNYSSCGIRISNSVIGHLYLDSFYIVPEYCDFGLEDFSLEFLFQPFTDTGAKYLARKCADDLSRGWALTYSWTDYKYRLTIADGTNTATIASSAVTAVENQEYHHLRVAIDRDGLAYFYINDVAAGSGSIATVTGNISVVEPLYVGGFDGTTDLAKGYLDFVRLRRGTLMTTAERALEYARIAAGRLRTAISEDVLFDFNDNLLDSAGTLLLASTPATDPVYADGWPYCVGPLTYAFTQNYSYGHRENYLDMDAMLRDKQTGAAFLYPGPRKREFILPFVGLKEAQRSAFWAAWEGGEPLDFWPDSSLREYYTCTFLAPPEYTSTPYFDGGEVVRDTELDLVET